MNSVKDRKVHRVFSYDSTGLKPTVLKKVSLLGVSISTGSYEQFVQKIIACAYTGTSSYACLMNVHMFIEAYEDKDFASIVSNADIIAPDGKPLSWALKILYGIDQERVAGMDMLPDLLGEAARHRLPVYFYGDTPAMLENSLSRIQSIYSSLIIAGSFSPPFRNLTLTEENLVIDKINNSGAMLVFVVLGCPKQEKWMGMMKGRINAMMVGIGGAMLVTAGFRARAPRWMQNKGLEWMFRLVQEPRRLIGRYYDTNTTFMYILIKEYVRNKFLK